MSDTWNEIQNFKTKQSSLRERFKRRRQERQEAVAEIIGTSPVAAVSAAAATQATASSGLAAASSPTPTPSGSSSTIAKSEQKPDIKSEVIPVVPALPAEVLQELEKILLVTLNDFSLNLPVDANTLMQHVLKNYDLDIQLSAVEDLLQKFAAQTLIGLSTTTDDVKAGQSKLIIDTVDNGKVSAFSAELGALDPNKKRKTMDNGEEEENVKPSKQIKKEETQEDIVESLLSMQSAKERETKKTSEEILTLLSKPTAKEQSLVEKFKSQGGAQVKEFCPNGTKEECMKVTGELACDRLHFRKIIHAHTDESLGDCSFLNTCFHMDTCKYVHYEIDYPKSKPKALQPKLETGSALLEGSTTLFPPQWIQCDLRQLDMSVLGKFAVVMADPPWDIHMELPYGTMSDNEMRNLSVPILSDDGYIFLWVTGRAMELGRECLKLWGYERIDELIWVKTNQLQRIIRTGRTGHWLNHGKEHCLVGVKGNPKNMNRGLDCDVIVAEVRATSHKPDEIYGIIERLAPGTRKIELFGRPHNVQPNWITLGNQLDGVKLLDPEVVKAFKKRYPDGNIV